MVNTCESGSLQYAAFHTDVARRTTALSAIYNLLDYPCCIVPAGVVSLEKDVADKAWYAQTPYDRMPNFPYDFGDEELNSLCMYRKSPSTPPDKFC